MTCAYVERNIIQTYAHATWYLTPALTSSSPSKVALYGQSSECSLISMSGEPASAERVRTVAQTSQPRCQHVGAWCIPIDEPLTLIVTTGLSAVS